jgi:hypothetical protein
MRHCHLLAPFTLATLVAACSEGRVATELPSGATSDGAVVVGTVVNTSPTARPGAGIAVSVVGTASSTSTDEAGRFVLSGLPEGAVTLLLKGADCDVALQVSGLVSGRAVTIRIRLAGSKATLQG